jgi:outer membrane protein, adhesin transport system
MRRCLLAGCVVLLSQQIVLASEPLSRPGAGSLGEAGAMPTLDQLLRQAVRTHPSILAQRAQRRVAEADVETALWARYPTLAAEASQGGQSGQGALARIIQPLWTGGRITGQIDNAQAGVTIAVATLAETEQGVLQETAQAYAELLRAQARLRAAKDNVAEHERLHQMILRRARTEVSPQSDVILASGRLQQALSEQIQFQNQAEQARATLEQLTGRPVEQVVKVQRPLPAWGGVAQVRDEALAFSPELGRLQAQESQAVAQIGLAKAVLLPSVSLAHEQRLGELAQGYVRSQTYVALQFQPGAGLSARSAVTAAAERQSAFKDQQEAARRKLLRQVDADWSELAALDAQLQPSRELVDNTRGVVESYARQYTAGRKSWLDVLNAQREAAQALFGLADVEANRLRAQLRLEIYTGRLSARSLSES